MLIIDVLSVSTSGTRIRLTKTEPWTLEAAHDRQGCFPDRPVVMKIDLSLILLKYSGYAAEMQRSDGMRFDWDFGAEWGGERSR